MKVLSIGNSFSQDSHKWLYKLAKACGAHIQTANLNIGGCSLEGHWDNVVGDNANYDLEINGGEGERKISIKEALTLEKWDVITLQQVSQNSGLAATYIPYLENLYNYVKGICPNAKIYFHQTWAYEVDFEREGFANYNYNQDEMFRRICDVTSMAAKLINAELIPSGGVIQKLRETVAEFDYQNGGMSLNRDGFHLTLDYGRFAAAATWFHTLTHKKIEIEQFEDFDIDINILKKIIAVVEQF